MPKPLKASDGPFGETLAAGSSPSARFMNFYKPNSNYCC